MKVTISVAALATALVVAGAAWSGNQPPRLNGSFKSIISGKTSRLDGTWVLKVDQFGPFNEVSKNGRIVVTGAVAAWLRPLPDHRRERPSRLQELSRRQARTPTR